MTERANSGKSLIASAGPPPPWGNSKGRTKPISRCFQPLSSNSFFFKFFPLGWIAGSYPAERSQFIRSFQSSAISFQLKRKKQKAPFQKLIADRLEKTNPISGESPTSSKRPATLKTHFVRGTEPICGPRAYSQILAERSQFAGECRRLPLNSMVARCARIFGVENLKLRESNQI